MYNNKIQHPAARHDRDFVHRITPDGEFEFFHYPLGTWQKCGACTKDSVKRSKFPVVTFASTWAEPVEVGA